MAEFPLPAFVVSVDHVQDRTVKPFCSVLAQGSHPGLGNKRVPGWDEAISSNIYVEPKTFTAMLEPMALTQSWHSTNSGIYSKLGLSAWTAAGAYSGDWKENDKTGGGFSTFLMNREGAGSLITNTTWGVNRGFVIEWFGYSDGGNHLVYAGGWMDTVPSWSAGYPVWTGTTGIGIEVFSQSQVNLYKDGEFLETYSIAPDGANLKGDPNVWLKLVLLPHRRRELIGISTLGGIFVHTFTDIAEDEASPIVLPATKFWIQAGPNQKPDFQVNPVQFPASGTLYSIKHSFARAPETGQTDASGTFGWEWGGTTYTSSIVDPDSPFGAFTPDGTDDIVRMKVVLTGATGYSPNVYGALGYYVGEGDDTPDETKDVTPYLAGFGFAFGETADSVRMGLDIVRPEDFDDEALTALSFGHLDKQFYRPCKVTLTHETDPVDIVDGWLMPGARWRKSYANADRIEAEIQDFWARLKTATFRDSIPLDGFTFTDAIEFLASIDGNPAGGAPVISANTYVIPDAGASTSGEWNLLIEAGHHPADWIQRIMSTFAPDWLYGVFPTAAGPRFKAISPADQESTPKLTLYATWEEAYDALILDGVDPALARKQAHARVYRSLRQDRLPPEATEVNVLGRNPRTGQPDFRTVKRDTAAEDPTVAVASRPDNWTGTPLLYGWRDTLITTQALSIEVATLLFPRVTSHREMVEFETEFLSDEDSVPIWRGDLIALDGKGTVRITSGQGYVRLNGDGAGPGDRYEDWTSRPTTYTGELVDDESPQPYRGVAPYAGLDAIRMHNDYIREVTARGVANMVDILKRSPSSQETAP